MFDNKDQEFTMPDADKAENTKDYWDAQAGFDPYIQTSIPTPVVVAMTLAVIGISIMLVVAAHH